MKPGSRLLKPVTMNMHDFKTVPRYNAAASAGGGAFIEHAIIIDEIPFTADFLLKRLNRTNTDGLLLVDAIGDSMEPTISNNDLIMIDTSKKQLAAAIFAFTYGENFYVKRLNNPPNSIEVISDNKTYSPFTISKDEMNQVNILGRVVWIGHTP